MKLIYFHTTCSRHGIELLNLVKNYCSDNEIEYTMYDCDEDVDAMNDYDLHGNAPAFIAFNDAGRKIATRKGKFTEEDLNKIFKAQ